MKIFLRLILFLALFSSCATIHYQSKERIPTFIEQQKKHKKFKKIKGQKDFFLWGLYPDKHIVYIDQILEKNGLSKASRIEIREEQSIKNRIISIISFGLYMPKNYEIRSRGER